MLASYHRRSDTTRRPRDTDIAAAVQPTFQEQKSDAKQGLGAAKDAQRMARIAKFYEKLPKGQAPERATGGLFGRYQARYMGKNPSAARK